MKPSATIAITLIIMMTAVMRINAQRRITPINTPATATQPINENREKNDTIKRSGLVETTDTKGNKILVDTITGKEFIDSTAISDRMIPKMTYPLLHSISVSTDIFTPAMRAFGQRYGLMEFAAEVNLHNRYIPVIEIGLGQAKNAPEDNNYTYRSPVSPFFRIGANYNFLYNSDPGRMFFAGIRYGFSPFKFSVTDISLDNGYWGESTLFDIPSQSVTAGYFEFLLGMRVNIIGNISLGWTVRYRSIIHESATDVGKPWYIPGFGSRNTSIGATFSVTYTIPFKTKKTEVIPETDPDTGTPDDTPVTPDETSQTNEST